MGENPGESGHGGPLLVLLDIAKRFYTPYSYLELPIVPDAHFLDRHHPQARLVHDGQFDPYRLHSLHMHDKFDSSEHGTVQLIVEGIGRVVARLIADLYPPIWIRRSELGCVNYRCTLLRE